MVKGIRHFGIITGNLEFALHFYRDLLGFEEVKRETLEGSYIENLLNNKGIKLTYVKLKLKGTKVLLELWYFHNNLKFNGLKASHIALTVDDLDELVAKLNSENIKFLSTPIETKEGNRVCFCTDYDSNLLEIFEEKTK